MNAFGGFIIRLLSDLIEMPLIFIEQVIGPNPISIVLIGVGSVFVLASVAVFAYVVLGALGVPLPSPGRGPGETIE
ncbi:hypothetical protein EGH24_07235 [Halonotius terrestris]|uniref:Uncharacterized protein n=1 Tax=Halonotius terrestris TaxID=2487750 RepID=A0A8J8P9F0_9EURY|nr:hypothetical protein [Halonotius terrestris]TQQ80941.1 hypothetical protein EGH24_07235 [Halonotius terrestris]